LTAALGIARRQLVRVMKTPTLLLPQLMFPLVMFAAFAGGVKAITGFTPPSGSGGFNYYNYTAFQFIFVLTLASGLSGIAIGLAAAQDFESGFARRMMLAVPRRGVLLVGYVLAGVISGLAIAIILLVVGLIGGMTIRGNALQVVGVFALASAFNVVASLFGVGLAMRARSVQIGPAMQMPVFLPLFFSPVYAPRKLLTDWLHKVANVNPMTPSLEAGRGLMAGQPVSVALAFGILLGFGVLAGLWAVTGLRQAERIV
jgi:ABC-2 type transport system permease protein